MASTGATARAPAGESEHQPTPIRISRRTWHLFIVAIVVVLVLIVWKVPAVLIISLGGLALALVLSFPARLFSRFVPRGLAILLSSLLVLGLFVLAVIFLVPMLVDQTSQLVKALPTLAQDLEQYFRAGLRTLHEAGLVAQRPEQVFSHIGGSLSNSLGVIASNTLGGVLGFLTGTFSFILTLFGVCFVGVSLLANVDNIKSSYLSAAPKTYRPDAQELWGSLGHALSRYLNGLGIILLIQGALTTVGLWLIGVPYALALGAWVSITAMIPYLGAWIGAIPGVLVAFSVSPSAVMLTALLYLGVQQLESNLLTPKIQGETVNVPPVVVFLTIIAAGGLAGVLGVLFAVPILAVLRVLFDFFRARLPPEPREATSP